MHLHALRHVPYEGLGSIGSWARSVGWQLSETRAWEAPGFPPPDAFDLLVILGGPMGVGDSRPVEWLRAEMAYLEQVIAAARPTLGICLGAQMIATVLGAEVRRQQHPEIGWHKVEPTESGRGSVLEPFFAPGTRVMQWHYDAFTLPEGAVRLCSSQACPNQAFSFQEHVLALQFHPEMTRDEVAAIVQRDSPLPTGAHRQSASEIMVSDRFGILQRATAGFMQRLAEDWSLGDRSQALPIKIG